MSIKSRSITLSRPPWSRLHEQDMGITTNTYTRALTYGQIKGIKGIFRMMKKLRVSKKLVDVVVNQTNFGQPGHADTYRVRIRYAE